MVQVNLIRSYSIEFMQIYHLYNSACIYAAHPNQDKDDIYIDLLNHYQILDELDGKLDSNEIDESVVVGQ